MPRPRAIAVLWAAAPVAAIALLLVVRASCHTAPLDRLAVVAGQTQDPPGTIARAGSIAILRGGPVIIGFQSDAEARLSFAGHEIRGRGVVKERIVVPHGAQALRFASSGNARLVWLPVGRRGEPEYVSASSLSPDAPAQATFDRPGTDLVDGLVALGILAVVVATLCALARRRLAAVPRAVWLAMAAVFVVALAVRLIGIGDQGQTWDEDVYFAAGRNYVTNVVALDFEQRSWIWNYEHPPVMKLLDGIGAQLSPEMDVSRAMSALWVALGCALLVPIGARLFRLRVGVLAAGIAALLPPLVAHGQVVGHEAPTVLWWSLGILLALGVHDGLPEPPDDTAQRTLALRLAGVGAVVGIALASRFVSGLLGPLCGAIVLVQAPPAWRKKTLAFGAAVMPLVAIATFLAVWPRLWGHPIAALAESWKRLDHEHGLEPFLGTITNHPGPHYFLVYLVATLPAGILAAVIAGAVRLARTRDRAALIVLAWFVIPLGVAASPVRQDGVRYVMPCVVVLAVVAAVGLDWLAERVARRWSRAFVAIAAAAALYLGVVLVRTAPYYLDYFGEHTGGAGSVARAKAFETAWWGEGLDRALAYVDEHAPPNAAVYRCIAPNHLAWLREDLWTMPPSPDVATWFVVYDPAMQGCPIPRDAQLVYANDFDGVTLAAVYRR